MFFNSSKPTDRVKQFDTTNCTKNSQQTSSRLGVFSFDDLLAVIMLVPSLYCLWGML